MKLEEQGKIPIEEQEVVFFYDPSDKTWHLAIGDISSWIDINLLIGNYNDADTSLKDLTDRAKEFFA